MSGENNTPTPPKKRRIALRTVEDCRREMARVYKDMRNREIETSDGSKLAYVLQQTADLIERGQLESRVRLLEDKLEGRF